MRYAYVARAELARREALPHDDQVAEYSESLDVWADGMELLLQAYPDLCAMPAQHDRIQAELSTTFEARDAYGTAMAEYDLLRCPGPSSEEEERRRVALEYDVLPALANDLREKTWALSEALAEWAESCHDRIEPSLEQQAFGMFQYVLNDALRQLRTVPPDP